MPNRAIFLTLLVVSLSACAQSPATGGQAAGTPPRSPATPPVSLTPQIMYEFLLGEIAGQRGDLKLAAEAYTNLASRTRDARVARRATEIALYARQSKLALRNAQLWQNLEPESIKAQQTLASLLVGAGRLTEARPYLASWIRAGKPEQAFMQLHSLFARQGDRAAVAGLVADLAAAYPALPEARYAVAQSAWQAGQGLNALNALDEVLRLRPDWEQAVLFRAQILQQKEGEDAAILYMRSYLKEHPQAREVRMAYAKQLARAGRLEESRQAFEVLVQDTPDDPEPHFALGLVAMQANDLDAAQASFLKALDLGYEDKGAAQYSLGQIAEARKDYDEALRRYKDVTGSQSFEAQLRVGLVLGKAGHLREARDWLTGLTPSGEAQVVRVAQAEAELLRDVKRHAEAFDVFDRALKHYPDNLELLYDRAMAAEKLNRLDVLERDLRRMIQLKPDYAHAYNALGYTLADRTSRLDEAIDLLQKALNLAPEDPFILDSMGWALFKAKRYPEAVEYLRRAYAGRSDPEIAAHLGEVLWVKGEREEARRVWQGGLKADPHNESLHETLSRLAP
ncbi:MAG TPA: tetratricopeptide repeat protein [Thiobacillaceae bacterium]|nr:tetratricopeptide repeat protein [Thiobacillaceae bacterium]HNU64777.1 tetratricopeptide repeat protein [Thiobacillaceae bacterium]